MRRVIVLPVLAVVALGAAGCTSTGARNSAQDFKGEQRNVALTVEDLQSAGNKGDQDLICSQLLARDLVAQLDRAKGGCAPAVDAALKDTDSSDLTVKSVRISGNTATVRVAADVGSAPDELTTMRLVRQDGRWKISSLG